MVLDWKQWAARGHLGNHLCRGGYKTVGGDKCREQLLTKDLPPSEEHDLFKETETVARKEEN